MKRLIYTAFMLLTFVSCDQWFDVEPKGEGTSGNGLFNNEASFRDYMNGIYADLRSRDLYGGNLTLGGVEFLAQTFVPYTGAEAWTRMDFNSDMARTIARKAYGGLYAAIYRCNDLLRQFDRNPDVEFVSGSREMMMAETRALRAFLHFDLLRMFGPADYRNNPEADAVPYRTSFDNIATPILPASEVLDMVIEDLLAAEELLEGHDSEIFNYDNSADPFTEMRQMRMNVWAVRAMLARVYCYKGDAESKALALQYALDVIGSGHFTLSTYDKITTAPIMPTEQIFSLYIDNYYQIVDEVFVNANASTILSAYETTVRTWYQTEADARYKTFRRVSTDGGQFKRVSQKYNQSYYTSSRDDYSGLNSQPLIRLPEMYYIAAECEPDAKTAAAYLDEVISTRTGQYSTTTTTDFDKTDTRQIYGMVTGQTVRTNELMKEYLKEYYGEGQLFFFYKRFAFTDFPGCPLDNNESMASHYQMPIPDDEFIFGNNN